MAGLLSQLDREKQIHQLSYYQPYTYQVAFHNAQGHMTPGKPARQRMLIAANKVGKTRCAAMEVAMHATGRYPSWYKGTRFLYAPEILVCGLTNDSVRDLGQRELLGDPTDAKALGTGTIPIEMIGKARTKTGVPNAFDSVRVQHISGNWARLYFRAYEQGWKKFQGIAYEVAWPDEEPPSDIWSQLLRGTIARKNAIIMGTMTPEEGMTQVVAQLLNEIQPGQAVVGATWDDAPHLTEETKLQILKAFPPHERDMRSKGIPLQGAGLIFPVDEDSIVCEPFEIPRYFRRINGIDFGWDHPFAGCGLAYDRDKDIVYMYAEYRESHQLPPVHWAALKPWGDWIPVAWPHDGLNTEKGGGESLANMYRDTGMNLLQYRATNAPDYRQGQQEGEGGNSVESPLLEMLERMQTGRWKVFNTCQKWLQERRMYHHDAKGKIVKQFDDLISASRYGYMMLRHARTVSVLPQKQSSSGAGLRNWA